MALYRELEKLGYLFYAVSPNKTSFETIEEIPDYSVKAVPHFLLLYILESFLLKRQNKTAFRLNDAIGSITQGMLSELSRIILQGWKIMLYIYVYNNWRLMTLPWDSLWTWWIAFVAVDFLYYWGHRASHEINFLWASHQVHHSSEEYNMSTALRQSIFQSYFLTFFYLPMALAVPPSAYIVHSYFNLLYQFWIHTEVIKSLGPLEYILNTASHHRVHHGRNRYCIDKNYAGTLIIWDRMFGTFEAEKEEVVYGLTHPINTFEPFTIQLCHYMHIWRMFWATVGWKNKLSVIFKGPGWYPGAPWHGYLEDIPEVKAPIEKYDPPFQKWCKIYVWVHFTILVFSYVELMEADAEVPRSILYGAMAYEALSLSVIGMLMEGRTYAPWMELVRCIIYFAFDFYFLPHTRLLLLDPSIQLAAKIFVRTTFFFSTLFWLINCISSISITIHAKKIE